MRNWTERYKPQLQPNKKMARRMGNNLQPQYKERCFFSIVFRAFTYQPNDSGTWRAKCNEYVFNPMEVNKNGLISTIAKDSRLLIRGNAIVIASITPNERVSVVPDNNKDINENNMKSNKKQVIRLTESDLHNVIKESVKKILNELDPRTYASYADKRAAQGQMNKAQQGRQAAAHAFNTSDVAHMKGGDPNYSNRQLERYHQSMKDDGTLTQFSPDGQNGTKFTNYDFTPSNINPFGTHTTSQGYTRENDYNGYETTDRTSWNDANGIQKMNEPQQFAQGRKIAQQMKNGTGQYVKGKGWQ